MHSSCALRWANTLVYFISPLSALTATSGPTNYTNHGGENCHYSARNVGYSTLGLRLAYRMEVIKSNAVMVAAAS